MPVGRIRGTFVFNASLICLNTACCAEELPPIDSKLFDWLLGVEVLLTASELSPANADEAEDDSCTIAEDALLEARVELLCRFTELHAVAEIGKAIQHANAINLFFIHVISSTVFVLLAV